MTALAPLELVCDLVRIPSVNPMGRDVSGPEFYEYAMTDYLEQLFGRLGLPCLRQQVAPLRSNIVARLDGTSGDDGPILLWEAHQDTVPVDGMSIAPWSPQVRQGRVYGRGACDIKGGMASMLSALSRLVAERPDPQPTIIMACSVNEEHGFSGATELAQWCTSGDCPLLRRSPDAAVIAEPTLLDVVVAHKGVVRWRCHALGRAAHSALPQQGDNAIYRMAGVVQQLRRYADEVVPQLGTHPLLNKPTLSVGRIYGGISVNTVPDSCTIEIDRRLLPGEDPSVAQRHAIDYLLVQLNDKSLVEHDEPFLLSSGLSSDDNGPLAEQLGSVAAKAGAGRRIGVPYGTNAPAFSAVGIPTVVFGPGSIEQAHTHDEWVEIEQLDAAADILFEFALRFAQRQH